MVITYHGLDFFKVQFSDLTIAVNPISKNSKWKSTRFGADIALISMNDPLHNGVSEVTFGEKVPFTITGPGEYEIKEVFIKGFPAGKNKEEKLNTIYTVFLEGMNLCFLGALGDKELGTETKEALPDIDILFIPIGGEEVITASDASKVATLLEAKIIIPCHFEGENALKAFLKEEGASGKTAVEKLTIKKKELEGKEGEIVVLSNTA